MFPFDRYLFCLILKYNNAYDSISKQLKNVGLTLSEEDLKKYRDVFFLSRIPEKYHNNFHEESSFKSLTIHLGIDDFFQSFGNISNRFETIFRNKLIQRHIECSFIAKMTPEEIYSDIEELYNLNMDIELLEDYRRLMIDISLCGNQNNWFLYMKTLPRSECLFKNSIILQPKDYVRWKLGIKKPVDPIDALKEMSTDLFWKYKESLADSSSAGLENTRRLCDTALKCFDKALKVEQSNKTSNKARDFNQLLLTFEDDDHATIKDITIDSVEEG